MAEPTIEDWEEFYREASAKTDLLAKKYPKILQTTLEEMEAADPAKGKSVEWMARQLNSGTILWPEDQNRLKNALESFWQIKKSPRILSQYSANPDLSTYTMQALEALDDKVRGVVERPESLTMAPPNTKKIYDDGVYAILEAETPEAACSLAKGTKWCTSDPETALGYLKRGGLYIWFKNGQKFAQSSGSQFMDLKDVAITADSVVGSIFHKVFNKLPDLVSGRIPDREEEISKDPFSALKYARGVVKGRWPQGERAIAQDAAASVLYANDVLNGRFPEGEPAILAIPDQVVQYSWEIVKGRWPEGERAVISEPVSAAEYAIYVLRGRWPEAENSILQDHRAASEYAARAIKGRWPAAEDIISGNTYSSLRYAMDAILGPFPKGEAVIAKDANAAAEYAEHCLHARFPLAEAEILRRPFTAIEYAEAVIKGRWPELEREIIDDGNWSFRYAKFVLKGRWPEGEDAIFKNPFATRNYLEFLSGSGISDPREEHVIRKEFPSE